MNKVKAYIEIAIVNVVSAILVCIGIAGSAFRKAKDCIARAYNAAKQWCARAYTASKHWATSSCFPWIRNAWYTIDYAFSRGWEWIKKQAPTWKEIRVLLGIGLAVIAAFYVALAVEPEPPTPTIRAGTQSLHIGPQVDLSDLEFGSDSANAALGLSGEAFFVKTAANGGSNANDCTSWDEACLTPQYVIDNHVVDGRGDTVFVGAGIYDGEIVLDKSRMAFAGVGAVNFENTSTVNGSTVISVTNGAITLRDFTIGKGEFVSLNSYNIYLDDVGTITLSNIDMAVAPVIGGPHTGIYVHDGDGIFMRDVNITGILLPIGNGIVFSDTVRSVIFDSAIGRLGTGILFTGATDELLIGSGTSIQSCSIGVQLDAGVTSNTVNAYVTDTPIEVIDNSGNGTNTLRGSLTSLRTATEHSGEMFPGTFYVVDGENGVDTNNGRSPDEAVATIGRALELVSSGDGVVIRADGVYTENIVIDTNAIQIFAAPGVVISGTGSVSPTVLVTGDNIWFRRQMDVLGGGVGICVEANNVRIDDVTVNSATVAFDIDGDNIILNNTRAAGYTVAGYDVSGTEPDISQAHASGSGGATIGYVISSTVSGGLFRNLSSVQNATTGFSVTLGAENNIFLDCTSGTGDGDRADVNITNMWSRYIDTQSRWRHEHNWPNHAGQGVAADPTTVNNNATDDTPDSRVDQDFWGDTVALIQIDDIDVSWRALGLEIIAGTANKNSEWEIFYPTPSASSDRNGGNAWDLAETVLTTDGSFAFLVDDLVWITSDSDPNGEIMIVTNVAGAVITVASETRDSGNTGLRYNHAGNEVMYLAERPGNEAWHATEGIYAAASAKNFDTIYFAFPRENQPSSAMIMRLLNGSDDLAFTFQTKPKFEATKEHD